MVYFFFSSRRRHTRYWRDWSSDVCSSDLLLRHHARVRGVDSSTRFKPSRMEFENKRLVMIVLSKAEEEKTAAVVWQPLICPIRPHSTRRIHALDRDVHVASKEKREAPIKIRPRPAEIVEHEVVPFEQCFGIGNAEVHGAVRTIGPLIRGRQVQRAGRTIKSLRLCAFWNAAVGEKKPVRSTVDETVELSLVVRADVAEVIHGVNRGAVQSIVRLRADTE